MLTRPELEAVRECLDILEHLVSKAMSAEPILARVTALRERVGQVAKGMQPVERRGRAPRPYRHVFRPYLRRAGLEEDRCPDSLTNVRVAGGAARTSSPR